MKERSRDSGQSEAYAVSFYEMTYKEFLETKIELATESGFIVDPEKVNKALKPHQRDAVMWAFKRWQTGIVCRVSDLERQCRKSSFVIWQRNIAADVR